MQGKSFHILTKLGLLVGLLGLVAPVGVQAAPTPQDPAGTRTFNLPLQGTTTAGPEPIALTGFINEVVTTNATAHGTTVRVTFTLRPTVGRGLDTGTSYYLTGRDIIVRQVPPTPVRLNLTPAFLLVGRGVPPQPIKPVDIGMALNAAGPDSIDNATATVIRKNDGTT